MKDENKTKSNNAGAYANMILEAYTKIIVTLLHYMNDLRQKYLTF